MEPLDEDEQTEICEDLAADAAKLDAHSRALLTGINCAGAAWFASFLASAFATGARVGAPGEAAYAFSYDHQIQLLAAGVDRGRMLAGYVAICAALGCGAARARRARLVSDRAVWVLAAAPAACLTPALPDVYAVALSLAAPVAWGLTIYVLSEMEALAGAVGDLDDLKYKHKSI